MIGKMIRATGDSGEDLGERSDIEIDCRKDVSIEQVVAAEDQS